MAVDAKDIGELQKALNDASGKASALWTTFVIFELYQAIAFGSVTHRDLFLEDPIKLPLLNVDLPLRGFFAIAPMLLVIFHFYVFLQILALSRKARAFNDLLSFAHVDRVDRGYLRQRLDSFLVLQFLVGPEEQRKSRSLLLIVWLTLFVFPVLILLQAQITFLPYHDQVVSWLHRGVIVADLAVIWYFRIYIRGDENLTFARVPSKFGTIANALLTFCILLSIFTVATFPGEVLDEYFPSIRCIPTTWSPHWRFKEEWTTAHELLFVGAPDEVTGRPGGLFSNRLVLTDQIFVDPDKFDKIQVSHSFRGRDLRQAVLNRADLRKADFTGAVLNGAELEGTKLQAARFGCAEKHGARSGCTYLQKADLMGAELQGADLKQAEMQGANLSGSTKLQGAILDGAQLQGAYLLGAHMQGASLWGTSLQGAELIGAELQGAFLVGANAQGSSLFSANLQGAALGLAILEGVNLEEAQLQGADFGIGRQATRLKGAALGFIKVWRAHGRPRIELADIDLVDSQTMPWEQDGARSSTFADWRADSVKDIPAGEMRDRAMIRLSTLDPVLEKDQQDVGSRDIWTIAPPPANERDKRLAAFLSDLACARGPSVPYVARGLLANGRIETTKTEISAVAMSLRKGKSDPTRCPGVDGFTEEDWKQVDRLAATR